jgi:hypothetical protein
VAAVTEGGHQLSGAQIRHVGETTASPPIRTELSMTGSLDVGERQQSSNRHPASHLVDGISDIQ